MDIAYFASSGVAAVAGSTSRNSKRWWFALSLGLMALGLLRLAEASLWIDSYLQQALYTLAWYAHRRLLQVVAIVLFAIGLFAVLSRLRLTSNEPALRTAFGAFYALAVLVAIRMSSLHWTDAILTDQLGWLPLAHVAQLLLLMVIASAAVFELAHGWAR